MLIRRPAPGVIAAAAALLTAVVVTALGGCGNLGAGSPPPANEPTVITSTTKIAGAGVLGNQRRPDDSCAPDPLPVDPGDARRDRSATPQARPSCARSRNESWCSPVTSSTRCARWVCSHASSPPRCPTAPTSQPSYLGTVVHDLPAVGTRSEPDLDAIRAAKPDLILGSEALTPRRLPGAVGDRADGVHRRIRGRLGGQPADGRRGDRAGRRRQRA